MLRRLGIGLFALIVLGAAFGGVLLSKRSGGEAPDVRLQVLSPHWEGIRYEFGRAFTARYRAATGREALVEWIDQGGTENIERWIRNEFARNSAGGFADVFFGGGVATYMSFADEGWLEPLRLSDATLGDIPKAVAGNPVYDEGFRWYGACFSGFGIIYNKEVGRRLGLPPVSEWEDLANPRLRGWVSCGDPRSSGSVHTMYEVILQSYGFDKGYGVICRMAGNVRSFNEGGSSVPRDVGLAEAYCGTSIDFYALDEVLRHGEDKVGYSMPRGLSVVNADPVGILKGAPNMAAARAFVEFVLSEEGQELWYLKPGAPGGPERFGLNRMPVRRSVYTSDARTVVRSNPFEFDGGFVFDARKAARRKAVINDLFKASILDVHADLKAAWGALHAAGMPEEAARVFDRPVAGEQEIEELASGLWNDPVRRNEIIADWSRKAREKFSEVVRMCSARRRD